MISDAVKEALAVLGFKEVPEMKTVRDRFLRLCLEKHPDKGGSDAEFQKLLEAKEVLCKYIEEFIPEKSDDDDEIFTRKRFKEFNEVTINKACVTIKFPTKLYEMYENSLSQRFGSPKVDNSSTGNGKHRESNSFTELNN